jgi:hypothetical protein
MSTSQNLSTSIEIHGKVSSDFLKASGISVAAFQKLQNKLNEVQTIQQKVSNGFTQMLKIAGGVALGDVLFKGFEKGLGFIEKGIDGIMEFGKQASEASAKFEVMSKGICNLVRDQGFADKLLNNLQQTAYSSPLQLSDLGGVARDLTGRGMDKSMLESRTKELGVFLRAWEVVLKS